MVKMEENKYIKNQFPGYEAHLLDVRDILNLKSRDINDTSDPDYAKFINFLKRWKSKDNLSTVTPEKFSFIVDVFNDDIITAKDLSSDSVFMNRSLFSKSNNYEEFKFILQAYYYYNNHFVNSKQANDLRKNIFTEDDILEFYQLAKNNTSVTMEDIIADFKLNSRGELHNAGKMYSFPKNSLDQVKNLILYESRGVFRSAEDIKRLSVMLDKFIKNTSKIENNISNKPLTDIDDEYDVEDIDMKDSNQIIKILTSILTKEQKEKLSKILGQK